MFSADEAERRAGQGKPVILVRIETSPEDIHGMKAARGVLTARVILPAKQYPTPTNVKLTFAQGGRPEKHRGESVEKIAVSRGERSAAEKRREQHARQSRTKARSREREHLGPIDANS